MDSQITSKFVLVNSIKNNGMENVPFRLVQLGFPTMGTAEPDLMVSLVTPAVALMHS